MEKRPGIANVALYQLFCIEISQLKPVHVKSFAQSKKARTSSGLQSAVKRFV
jgi:hypothetical protein